MIAIAYGLAIEHDYGRHIQFITKDDLAQSIKWNLVATVTFILSLVFSKMSVCFLFLRIVGSTCSRVKYAFLYGMMALAITVGSLNAFYTAGQCRPITKDWDHDIPGKCHGDISVDIGMAQGGKSGKVTGCPKSLLKFFPLNPSLASYSLHSDFLTHGYSSGCRSRFDTFYRQLQMLSSTSPLHYFHSHSS